MARSNLGRSICPMQRANSRRDRTARQVGVLLLCRQPHSPQLFAWSLHRPVPSPFWNGSLLFGRHRRSVAQECLLSPHVRQLLDDPCPRPAANRVFSGDGRQPSRLPRQPAGLRRCAGRNGQGARARRQMRCDRPRSHRNLRPRRRVGAYRARNRCGISAGYGSHSV